jgi:hypothetical protein
MWRLENKVMRKTENIIKISLDQKLALAFNFDTVKNLVSSATSASDGF